MPSGNSDEDHEVANGQEKSDDSPKPEEQQPSGLVSGAPNSLGELFELYYDRYKPLYNQVQTYNRMPVALINELAAAWDHLSRYWKYGESEKSCCDKAA